MTTNFNKVREFHETYKCLSNDYPQFPSEDTIKLRNDLLDEEFNVKLQDAINDKDIVKVADALTGILCAAYSAGLCFGIDLDATLAEVHRSNMSKLGEAGNPIYREDGKVLNGPNYCKPDLQKVLGVKKKLDCAHDSKYECPVCK